MRRARTTVMAGPLAGLLLAIVSMAAGPEVRRAGDVAYVTGGIGHAEQEALEALGHDFTVRVTFTGRSGQYLAAVPVTILDAEGDVVLDVTTEGPFLLVDLAPGSYTVRARAGDTEGQQAVTVKAGTRVDTVVMLPVASGPEPANVPERAD